MPTIAVPTKVSFPIAAMGYTHTQGGAATAWTITHNLGARPKIVEIYDTNWQEVWAQVVHTSANVTTITFNVAQAGTARIV